MAAERDPGAIQSLHATAVAIGDRALLIRGASRAGKSRLAVALIGRSTAALPIRLIGDDRILLKRTVAGIVARPHPRIAGFIERRGLGLVAMPWVEAALVGGIVDVGHATCPERRGADPGGAAELAATPRLGLDCAEDSGRLERVLAWWAGVSATWAPHHPEKTDRAPLPCAKD